MMPLCALILTPHPPILPAPTLLTYTLPSCSHQRSLLSLSLLSPTHLALTLNTLAHLSPTPRSHPTYRLQRCAIGNIAGLIFEDSDTVDYVVAILELDNPRITQLGALAYPPLHIFLALLVFSTLIGTLC